VFLIAVSAIDGLAFCGLEWYFAVIPAVSAFSLMHFSRTEAVEISAASSVAISHGFYLAIVSYTPDLARNRFIRVKSFVY
jgi:hypothetical protein